MTNEPQDLRPATVEDLTETLSFALRFNGKKRATTGDEFMARITAERLIEHLRISGYVVMKKPTQFPPPAGTIAS